MNDVRPLDRQTAEMYAAWFKALADGTLGYLIEWRIRRFRLTGEQKVPARVWFQSADDYLKAVGKSREVELFRKSGTHSVGMPGVA